MRTLVLVAVAAFAFPFSSLGSGRSDVAFAVSAEQQTPLEALRIPQALSLSPEPGNAVVPSAASSFLAQNEANERRSRIWSCVWTLLATCGVLAIAAKAAAIFRRRRRERELLLQSLYVIKDAEALPARRSVPRCLPTNPYIDSSAPDILGLQIEQAAEASREFGRVLGVVFYDLGRPPKDENNQTALDWVGEVAELVMQFKACLRATDHVAFLKDRELVFCIALLPGRTELMTIASRLGEIGRKHARFASAFRVDAGLAIYPLCGYRGDELVEHARADYAAHRLTAETIVAPESESYRKYSKSASDVSAAV